VSTHSKPTVDPSLLDLFRAEMDTHLPVLSAGLLALEKGPAEAKRLEALMRAAHSIKGAARIVGVGQAVQVAHALEDCFVAAQQGQLALGSDAIDVLLRGVDVLQRTTPPADDPQLQAVADEELRPLLDDLAAVRAGRSAVQPPPRSEGPPTLRPAGDLDAAGAEAVRGRLAELLRACPSCIRLDFTAVGAIDSAGLALLAGAARRAEQAPQAGRPTLQIVNAAAPVRVLLRLTRLDRAYQLVEEEG